VSTDPSLALQKLLRGRLAAATAVTALVTATSIEDRSGVPETFPCILIGDGFTDHADNYDSFHERTFADIHLWTEELGLARCKAIAAAVRDALRTGPWSVDGHTCVHLTVARSRFLRDPDGSYGHGVLTIEAILQAVAA
jgi:hypothetical protein